ncbi:MAG: DNA repair protein RecN [Proteobacteria bacterium]|uniref:DNA repair protein RecN n=1 Tax=Rudaea sp. TaxID=2136325 RepID=UPI0032201630|nr:DNA repair protein RecN [Pseudomonadota bacterium]
MLQTLFVKDFAIVGEAEIGFGPGLTVVTGETGAGKSLMVDALLLLAGQRADAGVVRHGSERAELIADFDLTDAPAARQWLADQEFDDGDDCQLRRVIRAEGASRAWINGRPATLAQMQALAERLIEIHGQHEHQALLDKTSQLALLDAFGDHAALLQPVAALAARWRGIDTRMRELQGDHDHSARIALLSHQVEELDRHALEPAELEALDELHKRLANAGHLIQGTSALAELLDGEGEFSLLRLIHRAQGEIARLAQTDAELGATGELLDAAGVQLDEANSALARYRDALDLDPDKLAEAETQIAKLHELGRKHRIPPADLKIHAQTLRDELETLQDAGAALAKLERERGEVERDYRAAAANLSAARAAAASALGGSVSALMDELGMAGGRFDIEIARSERTTPDAQGLERVEFLVSANPGQPARALRRVASGGELSRISLAIEVAALGADDASADATATDLINTLVFDEVDSGIGGAIAEVVGQKLRRLGAHRQVLCVTHLPQVAAQGHHHLRVTKSSDGASTLTLIESLDEKARRDEIARMLGGVEITRETLAHARQMLEKAQG